jgi:DNA polymerase-3 subunit epsilon
MNFVAIDVETANSFVSSICQIGIAGYASGRLASEWEILVNPLSDFDPWNTAIHGITEYMVTDAPALADIYEALALRLHGRIVVSHTQFDRVSLTRALKLCGLPPIECVWLDSSKVARRAWKQFARKGYALKNVCDYLGYEFEHHNALADAKAAGFIMLEACRHTGLNIEDWLV